MSLRQAWICYARVTTNTSISNSNVAKKEKIYSNNLNEINYYELHHISHARNHVDIHSRRYICTFVYHP